MSDMTEMAEMSIPHSMAVLKATQGLDALYPVLADNRMTAGWHKKRASLWPEPQTAYRPSHWSFEVGATALDRAGLWMDTVMAERRNVLLFNQVEDNDYDSVRTLVAAYQMVKPGEYARAHRHSPNALRLVLDAPEGCYTVVDGVKLPMRTGDLLLTPSNAWHSHFNDGTRNAYWIDVLDVPLVHRLEPMFVEHLPGGVQDVLEEPPTHPFAIALDSVTARLQNLPSHGGVKQLEIEGGLLKTMTMRYHQLELGASQAFVRNTASRVFCVLEGQGEMVVGERTYVCRFGDVIAVPSWKDYRIIADTAMLMVEISDEAVMHLLGFYREAK